MINVNGLKRNAKNIVKKYSDAQIKVREATSNDPWGPSSTIMAEIADLTYNVVAFSEIMQMIWKRLNDHGRNWRHVYKALVVLEYLIKTGSDKVAQQCTENIFAIQTLKDFQYMEENKDHGMNIREKSKKLVALLKDSEKLQAERARAIKAKSRLAESMSSVGKNSIGSLTSSSGNSGGSSDTAGSSANSSYLSYLNDNGTSTSRNAPLTDVAASAALASDLDSARPQTVTEEEDQLKLALALSKEEAEQQEKTRKNDELRLKLALDVSKKTAGTSGNNLLDDLSSTSSSSSLKKQNALNQAPANNSNTIDDLLGLTIPPVEPQNDPWSVQPTNDPWQPVTTPSTNMPTMNSDIRPMPLATATSQISQTIPMQSANVFNKRPMSKNPFED